MRRLPDCCCARQAAYGLLCSRCCTETLSSASLCPPSCRTVPLHWQLRVLTSSRTWGVPRLLFSAPVRALVSCLVVWMDVRSGSLQEDCVFSKVAQGERLAQKQAGYQRELLLWSIVRVAV